MAIFSIQRYFSFLFSSAAEIISNIQFPEGTGFYPDIQDGKYGFNTDPERGADTFLPFNSGKAAMLSAHGYRDACFVIKNEYGKKLSFNGAFLNPGGNTSQVIVTGGNSYNPSNNSDLPTSLWTRSSTYATSFSETDLDISSYKYIKFRFSSTANDIWVDNIKIE